MWSISVILVAMATNEDKNEEEYKMPDTLYLDGEMQDINSLYRQNSMGGNYRRKCVVRLDGARYTIGIIYMSVAMFGTLVRPFHFFFLWFHKYIQFFKVVSYFQLSQSKQEQQGLTTWQLINLKLIRFSSLQGYPLPHHVYLGKSGEKEFWGEVGLKSHTLEGPYGQKLFTNHI